MTITVRTVKLKDIELGLVLSKLKVMLLSSAVSVEKTATQLQTVLKSKPI
jgi:hypothetical protein